jgi:hypothetical protein
VLDDAAVLSGLVAAVGEPSVFLGVGVEVTFAFDGDVGVSAFLGAADGDGVEERG